MCVTPSTGPPSLLARLSTAICARFHSGVGQEKTYFPTRKENLGKGFVREALVFLEVLGPGRYRAQLPGHPKSYRMPYLAHSVKIERHVMDAVQHHGQHLTTVVKMPQIST